jgi:surfactin synthase thioesterase subunit
MSRAASSVGHLAPRHADHVRLPGRRQRVQHPVHGRQADLAAQQFVQVLCAAEDACLA